jgi:hypothetical protein
VADLQKTLASANAGEARAQARLQLGQTLDEIRELFNRDIEAHGKVQGLASSVLLSELTARGTPLAYSARANRFTANLTYYREALRWRRPGRLRQKRRSSCSRDIFDSTATIHCSHSQSCAQLANKSGLAGRWTGILPRAARRDVALAIHGRRRGDCEAARHAFSLRRHAKPRPVREDLSPTVCVLTLTALLPKASGPNRIDYQPERLDVGLGYTAGMREERGALCRELSRKSAGTSAVLLLT